MAFIRNLQYTKQPSEEYSVDVAFGNSGGFFDLPPGAIEIVSATASAIKWHRQDPDNKSDASDEILLDTDLDVLSPRKSKVRLTLTGGEDNYDYQITVNVVFDNDSTLEKELYVRVRED